LTTKIESLLDTPTEPISFAGLSVATAGKNPDQRLKLLIYGDSGKGKSVLAASADEVPEMSPVLYINAEAGALSVAKFYPGVHVLPLEKFMDLEKILQELRRGNHPYKTVVVDSLTELHKKSMEKIMVDTVAKDKERDAEIPSQREWGKAGLQVQKVIRYFRDLPLHVIFVALEAEQGEEGSPKTTGPALPGKLLKEVPGYMDVVGRMYTRIVKDEKKEEIVKRILWTGNHPRILAKDRSAELPALIENPTMTIIYDAFKKALQ
jgi:AAA domain